MQDQINSWLTGIDVKFDFRFDAPEHPIIYTILDSNDKFDPSEKPEVQLIIDSFIEVLREHQQKLDQLTQEEKQNSRGDFIINRPEFLRCYDQFVYKVDSKYFASCFRAIHRQSIENPKANEDPDEALIGLYTNYYGDILPPHKSGMDFAGFRLMMIQQFLYFSNGFRRIRLDLFREVDPETSKSPSRFAGGIFHILDHHQGFGSAQKGNEPLHPVALFANVMYVALHGDVISSKERNGNYDITLEKDCKVTVVEEGKPLSYKIQKHRLVMYYDKLKELYYLKTFYPIR